MSGNAARLQAIFEITNREPVTVSAPESLKDIWACDVFNIATMENALSKNAVKAMKKTVQTGAAVIVPLQAVHSEVVHSAARMLGIDQRKRNEGTSVFLPGGKQRQQAKLRRHLVNVLHRRAAGTAGPHLKQIKKNSAL